MWLDFDVFLADPVRHFTAVAAHFEIEMAEGRGAGDLRGAVDGPLFESARL